MTSGQNLSFVRGTEQQKLAHDGKNGSTFRTSQRTDKTDVPCLPRARGDTPRHRQHGDRARLNDTPTFFRVAIADRFGRTSIRQTQPSADGVRTAIRLPLDAAAGGRAAYSRLPVSTCQM